MISDGALPLILAAVFAAAVAALPFWVLRQMERQTRGTFGRPYSAILGDLLLEGRRRLNLLGRLVDMREARIARLERRLESGR